jgi:hypothetical protein
MVPDFSGYATRAGIRCTDGVTIQPNAFKEQDGSTVPLLWAHGHTDPAAVLGHAVLTNKPDGVWVDAFFNGSKGADAAKSAVEHGDIKRMSIWANRLKKQGDKVLGGVIREVSLVLAAANEGATIEKVYVRHDDGSEEEADAMIITTGEFELKHADGDAGAPPPPPPPPADNGADRTVGDVVNEMTPEQQAALDFIVQQALEGAAGGAEQDSTMTHFNPFESADGSPSSHVLSHDEMGKVFEDAKRTGSFRTAIKAYAEDVLHGVENIGLLFPEAHRLDATPQVNRTQGAWVDLILNGTRKSPFAKVRSDFANVDFEESRAKGYATGTLKEEAYYSLARRETDAQTVYTKDKVDRDVVLDITDFAYVTWVKQQMQRKLEEELARAILVGDGRPTNHEQKIHPTRIRPVVSDDPAITLTTTVNYDPDLGNVQVLMDAIVMALVDYTGSGNLTMFTSKKFLARAKLLKDAMGRQIYASNEAVANALGVDSIVPVELLSGSMYADNLAIIFDVSDYVIGANKGGEMTSFDDFDIDYNQYKYLLETRVSGALTKLGSAVVVKRAESASTGVDAEPPTQDPDTYEITVPSVTGVVYTVGDGSVIGEGQVAAAGTYAMTPGTTQRFTAKAAPGYFLNAGTVVWEFMRPTGS